MKSLLLLTFSVLLVAAVSGVHWSCVQQADCEAVPQAFCATALGECRCPAGHTFAGNVTVCVRESLNGEPCDEDGQCAHMLTGAHCSANGVCECVNGYTYIRGRCRQLKPLHERCDEEVDCYFGYDRESVTCVEGTCQCTPDYYQRDENICRRRSMNAGDPCVVHEDCVGEQQFCNDFTLECEIGDVAAVATQTDSGSSSSVSSSGSSSSNSIIHIGRRDASTSTDHKEPERGVSEKTVTFSQTQTSVSSANDDINIEPAKFGDACVQTADEPCPGLPHSECVLAQCRCRRGYYAERHTGRCMAEIGEVAAAANLCSGDGMNAMTGRCMCEYNRYAMAHLRECIKPGFGLGFSCTEQSQCSPFGAAFCPGVNAPPGTRVCTCHPYAKLDSVRQLCVPRRGLGAQCTATADCATQTPDTVCDDNVQQCVCRTTYVPTEADTCAAGVTADCQADDQCAPENTVCATDGRCACKPDFVHVGDKCLPAATAIDEPCVADEQCQPLLGARGKCIDDQCKCEAHLQHSNGQCNRKRALEESCTSAAECHVTIEPENVVCRKGACGCKFGTHKDTAKLVCRKNSSSRISALKAITLLLIAAAVGVTTAAIHDAYY